MNDTGPLLEVIHACLEGRASESDWKFLNEQLRHNSAARDLYLEMADLHSGLSVEEGLWVGRRPAAAALRPAVPQWFRSRWMAAAAGLVVGLSGASFAWAIASPWMPRTMALVSQSFAGREGRLPSGIPRSFGVWGGDEAEIVRDAGAGPKEEPAMLRFLKAEPDEAFPGSPAGSCDVFRVVDLRPYRVAGEQGDSVLQFSAAFSDRRASFGEALRFSIRIFVFSGDWQRVREKWPQIRSETVSSGGAIFDSFGGAPQAVRTLSAKALIPAQGDFAVVQLVVGRLGEVSREPAVFGEQYASNVRLTLKSTGRGALPAISR
ncbi:MAG: hypothetical protein RLZZ142_1202 [Verrucomicrobiota bacterium]|jgi:hypothetical protein